MIYKVVHVYMFSHTYIFVQVHNFVSDMGVLYYSFAVGSSEIPSRSKDILASEAMIGKEWV